jgi:hypothetical protein
VGAAFTLTEPQGGVSMCPCHIAAYIEGAYRKLHGFLDGPLFKINKSRKYEIFGKPTQQVTQQIWKLFLIKKTRKQKKVRYAFQRLF